MSEKWYDEKEAAKKIKVSIPTVYYLVETKQLRGIWSGTSLRIPHEALVEYLERTDSWNQNRRFGEGIYMIRRDFIIGFISSLLATGAYAVYTKVIEKYFKEEQTKEDAIKVFEEVLGHFDPRYTFSFSVGNKVYPTKTGFHPDNLAGGMAILKHLRPPLLREAISSIRSFGINPCGNVVVMGGPVGATLTKIAFEFEGPTDRELVRRPDSIIPLRFYAIADEKDSSIKNDIRLAWSIEEIGFEYEVNWHLIDAKKHKRKRVQPGKRIVLEKGEAFLPKDNYLTVTRMPNFLDPGFRTMVEKKLDPIFWPYLLIFDGRNGIGTRASELLVTEAGIEALKRAKIALGAAEAFQINFRVTDLDITKEGFHRFNKIEIDDDGVEPLDNIDNDTYLRAHEYAMERTRILDKTS